MKLIKAAITFLVLLAPLAVLAQSTATPKFDQRQVNQEQRIQQGAQSGSLTPKEAARLEQGQGRLQAREDRVKADGVVTPQERKNMQHAENRQSRRIYEEKHDRQHDYNHNGKKDRPHGRR
jgi:CRISPR/Cas system CSM-associated protein Csm2 small subunit